MPDLTRDELIEMHERVASRQRMLDMLGEQIEKTIDLGVMPARCRCCGRRIWAGTACYRCEQALRDEVITAVRSYLLSYDGATISDVGAALYALDDATKPDDVAEATEVNEND